MLGRNISSVESNVKQRLDLGDRPLATSRKWAKSRLVFRANPSATLLIEEMAARTFSSDGTK